MRYIDDITINCDISLNHTIIFYREKNHWLATIER